ncbi:MAG TPA: SDR family oxidoreductase [Pyrinomonadaceae bacterium]|jgi:thioester reductase-like protein|nr:SDR family oxidoreductase [Pyrinomonadaceae bacterium]
MLSEETIFLTGFPGFIAGRLLQRLATAGARLLLLVQPAFAERAQQELIRIADATGRSISDFVMLLGDITESDLGLSRANLEMARSESTILFHLAAIYDLAVARDIALRVNVEGTRNVNAFARSLPSLRHYHYVSTCYVAGKRRGRILETELQHDAGFRNYYEETKYLAELEVEALKGDLPVTVHRPAVVCGDTRTGETAKYDGIYYLIHYLLKWPAVLSAFNIGNREVALNLVPVDFVVEAMASLACDPLCVGKTLQLADPNPLTTQELFNTIARVIAGREALLTLPAPLVQTSLMLPLAPKFTDLPHSAVPYFFLKQTYDATQVRELLEPRGVSCPPFNSYVETIVDYAKRHPQLS